MSREFCEPSHGAMQKSVLCKGERSTVGRSNLFDLLLKCLTGCDLLSVVHMIAVLLRVFK